VTIHELIKWGLREDPEAAAIPALLVAFIVLMLVAISIAENVG